MSQLEVRDLSYRFPDGTHALQQVSFTVEEGSFTVIAGRNGSGKTILLRILNGLIKPTSGDVRIEGIDAAAHPYEARKKFGLVFQQADSQIVGQTVSRDIAFGLENTGVSKEVLKVRVQQMLEMTGLTPHAHQRPRTLSGGEKRRLTIADVMAVSPGIIALDEPFSGLDYPGVLQVLHQLVQLNRSGHTVILVTHDLEKVLAHADTLILMDQGRIAAQGPVLETLPAAASCGVRMRRVPTAETIRDMTWLND
ncbi:MAG: energy-coupling factor ABC transporter ATP-binding protein [Spirochaetia bacterium]|nr:energy-coupling factor ABC transporter ATP-binding protein [Spirochaetia bacterium]MCF7941644.1 energy-coupling factor ABC transporter ATP-binding protein [Spirochaetia bacterium]